MSFAFSEFSKEKLASVDPHLVEILEVAIKIVDFKVLEGHRNKTRQNELYEQGKSKIQYPAGKHNSLPSKAVDIAPCPIDWVDAKRFIHLAGIIIAIGYMRGHKIRWGGNWDMDQTIIDDQSFNDLVHFELVD